MARVLVMMPVTFEAAEKLLKAIQEFRFLWEDRTFRLGASIGVVPITPETASVAELLTAADSACAAAKESGRNRVHTYQVNDIDLMRRRREMQWAARINNALEEARFELFRMTIMPLQEQDQGAHYELLLRMKDENGQIVAPDVFINAAERYGITPSIDRWVIQNALRWLVSEADERKRLSLCSINLSGQSLGDDKFLPFVIEQFEKSGLDATKICFEITETAAVFNLDQATRTISIPPARGGGAETRWVQRPPPAASNQRTLGVSARIAATSSGASPRCLPLQPSRLR